MKAKELAKLLLKTPEAEVAFRDYTGCTHDLFPVGATTLLSKGSSVQDCSSKLGKFNSKAMGVTLSSDVIELTWGE